MNTLVPRSLWRRLGALWRADQSAEAAAPQAAGADDGARPDGGRTHSPEVTRRPEETNHLRNVPDGAGCTEIWEYLSERDAAEAEGDD